MDHFIREKGIFCLGSQVQYLCFGTNIVFFVLF